LGKGQNFLANSYTRFRNKIGLNIDGKFLRQRGEVSLVWPYKDCVLEGGQTKEEEKRKEIFFNEILAQDEIDRLFDPKVLTNWKRHTLEGEQKVTEIKRDENATIRENLVVKGNNLLALHSLKNQFQGKVKLIYIDPPYNTGNDEFRYNDNFNHSSWLTFMKNRLEVAKDFLSFNGLIYVQCDDNESAYLKILLDEVFGRNNFISQIAWQRSPEGRTVLGQGSSFIVNSTENILCYAKAIENTPRSNNITKYVDATEKALRQYNYYFISEGERKGYAFIEDAKGNPINIYKHENYEIKKIPRQADIQERLENFDKLVRIAAQQEESSLQQKILTSIEPDGLFSVEYTPTIGKNKGNLKKAFYLSNGIILFLRDYAETDGERVFRKSAMNDFWSNDEIQVTGIADEGGVLLRRGKKPEKLLQRIIEMSTSVGDIVMDFFIGSGTTAAVAHKLVRQYIGIEQLDYGKKDCVYRLQNVIKGEQSGISKLYNWKGGGDFIYCELMKYNEAYIEKIQAAKSSKELVELWKKIAESSFLNWYVNPEIPEEAVNDFIEIGKSENGLEKQKKLLAELLNKNQLYVNLSEIEDADFNVSEEDKKLNQLFYGENA
jgi:adenine-specific DNA-methyltransferase